MLVDSIVKYCISILLGIGNDPKSRFAFISDDRSSSASSFNGWDTHFLQWMAGAVHHLTNGYGGTGI